MKIGYARVSTDEQVLDSQIQHLESIGCEKIFTEKQSGKTATDRCELNRLLEFCREGDEIHVTKVDRLARNTLDALQIADRLQSKQVGLYCHDLGDIDINSDIGRVIYSTISAFAEIERKRILQRCSEGRELAKQQGRHLGRHADQQLRENFRKIITDNPKIPKAQLAKELGCSRTTIYQLIKEFYIQDNSNSGSST
ncbi:recombinase family protein [Paraglaciecola sp.]|uniref:recombinase family protein n=1 Tax=Paraglaciecola sp. TaxID=1920173 RepID=UPI003EF9F010